MLRRVAAAISHSTKEAMNANSNPAASLTDAARRRALRRIAGVASASVALPLLSAWRPAFAADAWPTRSITLICPFAAGISIDVLTRAVANSLTKSLGQQVVVDNRPGGAGTIGAAAVARAQPDGYTFLVGTAAPTVTAKYLFKNLSYDPQRAFTPVTMLASSPLIIVGSPKLPVTNFRELVEYAKKNPGALSGGSVGVGSHAHITLEWLNKAAGINITHVPYRDVNQALPNLVAGDLQVGFNYIPTFVANVQAGTIKGLAVSSPQRLKELPNVPTLSESGFPGFETSGWSALLAPAGTPQAIIDKINAATNAFLGSEEGKQQVGKLGMLPIGGSAADLKKYLEREDARWGPIIKEANITPQS
jgi:tripartite-type tricarboxylate transporter receptor subunit TctC